MKKIIITTALAIVTFTSTAFADGNRQHVNGVVKDIYSHTKVPVHRDTQECKEVDVPIYSRTENNDVVGDTLLGAIIGGAIGNQIGDARGNGAAGAVIGGLIGNSNSKNKQKDVVVGYKRETVCNTIRTTQYETVSRYVESEITFTIDGRRYTVRFKK